MASQSTLNFSCELYKHEANGGIDVNKYVNRLGPANQIKPVSGWNNGFLTRHVSYIAYPESDLWEAISTLT